MVNPYWQQFSDKFNAMSRRERAISLLAVLALLYLLWSLFVLAPVSADIDNLLVQKQTLDSRLLDLQAQERVFTQAASHDPYAASKREIDYLQQRLETLDKELQALAVGLVPAELLPQVLHDVMSNIGDLKLLGMQTLPVQKLTITGAGVDANAAAPSTALTAAASPSKESLTQVSQQVDVYRHSVELKVRGSYFTVAKYLQELEALPWRFYWDKLDYRVDTWPQAVATLEVYTLSAGEGLLGE